VLDLFDFIFIKILKSVLLGLNLKNYYMKKTLLLGIVLITSVPLISNSQTLYYSGSGTWTGSVWSLSNSGPYTTAWVSGRSAEFDVPNSTITGATTTFSSITANEDVTVTPGGTINTGGNIATITVALGKTFDFGLQQISTATGTGLIKEGTGTLALSSVNAYPGGFTLNNGVVIARGTNAFGSGVLTINGGTIAGISGLGSFGTKQSNIIIGGNFTLGVSTDGIASSSKNLTFGSTINLGTTDRIVTLNGTGENTFSGIISSTGGGLTTGAGSTGTLILSGSNTYSGSTTLSGGTLVLGETEVIPNLSAVIFNGGTLKTGAFNETYSTINLSDNSTVILNNSIQSHNFAVSNSISWTSGKTLTITGWAGGYNSTSGTKGKIFVGTDATGLTASQLQQIKFFNGTANYDATILSTGEVVPSTLTVLPISLTSFTAKLIDKTILLNWATASEKNNQKFEVLKSVDGKNFKSIATVNGAGSSDTEKSYSFVDENPYAGANYYQLKQTDFNGTTATSTVISANAKIEDIKLSAYASSNSITININSPNQTDGNIALFDMNGRKLESKNLVLNKGYNEINFGKFLVPGTYFVNLISAGKSISYKFIK
jgi:autotransporter-associated beta strand protein